MSDRDPAEELAALRALLAAEHAKAEGFAHLSHELRNLLSGVVGITGLLLETELSGEQRDYVKRIRGLGDALSGLVNNVLDFSKLEAGKFELERADLDPRRIVDEVGELLAERAQGKGLELVASVAGDVPAGLRGDAARLRQVLINLVGNALKFTDRGEVVLRASLVQASSEEVKVRFEVRDTGVGISAEGQARLFQPFSQVHEGPSRAYGGTGLGLALSRQIVRALGGTIDVESEVGKGSRFHFTAALERRAPETVRHAIPRVDVAGHRVLCAAANAESRACLREMIGALGVECGEAADGTGAFSELRKGARDRRAYSAALLDVSLPGAIELFRALDTDDLLGGVPVVLMAYPGQRLEEDDRGEAAHPRPATGPAATGRGSPRGAVRVVTHLAKPVRQSQLHACLRTLMGSTVETVAPESRRGGALSRGDAHSPRARSISFAAPTPAMLASAPAPTPAPAPVQGAPDRPVILLVEDNEVNQRVGKLMVEKRGYRVEVASDGREAVEATLRQTYVAVLMDCQMPRFDGYSATAEIRARDAGKPRLPIIAMTANAGPGARERCLAAGMDDYVAKPVTPEALDEVLRRWAPRLGPAPIEAAPQARRPSSPVVDLSMLHKLRATQKPGESDIVADVIALFLAEATPRMEAIRDAAAKGDLATAGRTAHTLKGSAGHLGAKTLAARCSRLEEKVRAGAPFNSAVLVAAIEEELGRVHAALALEQRRPPR
jgi:CheY-like chemotaxis protein/anti-sigma regulatory factor (Ser/Thr protein kinase)